jgi:ATP-dependent helicase/nuclease subunit A
MFQEKDEWIIVDFKTDSIQKKQMEERGALYAPQLKLYADAIGDLSGQFIRESLLFFVRLGEVVLVPM